MNVGKGQKVVGTLTPPNGLRIAALQDLSNVDKALENVEALLAAELKGQIASNQHCYVNLPHPLSSRCFREAFVPLFSWGDERISGIEALFSQAVREMGWDREQDDLKARANVIVREYRQGQHIPFHFDDLECSEMVLGIVLLNDAQAGSGLAFRKGEDRSILQFVVPESKGCVFTLEGDARYSWTHGLNPVPTGRRISITCRFFKQNIIDKWRAEMDALPPDEPLPAPPSQDAVDNVSVTLLDGRDMTTKKAVVVPSTVDEKQLIALFKNKLRIKKVVRITLERGPWTAETVLVKGDIVIGHTK